MSTITTTLNAILAADPNGQEPADDGDVYGWLKLLRHLGKTEADDEPLSFETILESNGWDDCLWALRSLPESEHWRLHLAACDFAERVLPIFERQRPDDRRIHHAIATKRRWVFGLASDADLDAAWAAERDAVDAVEVAEWVAGAAGAAREDQQKILWRWLDTNLTKEQAQELVLGKEVGK